MRYLSLILSILLAVNIAIAEPQRLITKNVATRICGHIWDATTAKHIGAAPTGLDCEIDAYADGTSADGYTDLTTAEVTVGTTGAFCAILTQSEANVDYASLRCTATNTDAADWSVDLVAIKDVTVAAGGIGADAITFDGVTLAEGASTLDLEASEISADDQFVGDRVLLFDTSGNYYGSSCITDSTNTNERITTEEDLSSFHTVGDSYLIRPDAACYKVTRELTSTTHAELSSCPGATVSMLTMMQSVYQFIMFETDRTTSLQQMKKADGSTVLCDAVLSNSGGTRTKEAYQAP